jgi:two-component system, OmpR family, response regulator
LITLQGSTFLVAEDEPFTRTVLERALRNEGITVLSFPDGKAALDAMCGNLKIDGVLLDFMMPRAHGLHVLKEIRIGNTTQPRGLPVAMLTSINDRATVAASVMLDCDAFIVKPAQKDVLCDRMLRLLSRRGREPKSADLYRVVDVGPAEKVNVQLPQDLQPAAPVESGRERLLYAALREGMVLAEPLCTREGETVVPAGISLTTALLAVLGDLERIAPLRAVAVSS